MATALRILDLSGNVLGPTLPPCILALTGLSELNLQGALWKRFLGKAVSISLSGNGLKSLPADLTPLAYLEKLAISKNALSALPESLGSLSSLRELDASHNLLVLLPDELSRLTKLSVLNVSDNRISTLPFGISNLGRLRILDVRGNPLELPPTAVAEKGLQAIMAYLREASTGEKVSAKGCTLTLASNAAKLLAGSEIVLHIEARNDEGKRAPISLSVCFALTFFFTNKQKSVGQDHPGSIHRSDLDDLWFCARVCRRAVGRWPFSCDLYAGQHGRFHYQGDARQ